MGHNKSLVRVPKRGGGGAADHRPKKREYGGVLVVGPDGRIIVIHGTVNSDWWYSADRVNLVGPFNIREEAEVALRIDYGLL